MPTARRPVRMLVRRRLFMKAKKVAPLNLSASRQNWNLPSRNRTAPKYPTLFRVGACSKTGSLVSGGIHIWQREPCCWKCTSSVAQRSTVSSCISAWSFFYAPFAVPDRLEQYWGAACATESPTAGTDAGTDALPGQSHTSPQSRPRAFCHPIKFHPIPYRGASYEEQHLFLSVDL